MTNPTDTNQPDHNEEVLEMVTDTNQASEKELDTFMEQLGFFWDSFQSDWRNNGRKQFSRDYDDSISMELAKQLLAHLLTEKLKLLAAVRERVVGEPISHDWDDDIEDMTKWKYYTGYKSNADDFVAGYNRSRAERLEQLAKLEAEL